MIQLKVSDIRHIIREEVQNLTESEVYFFRDKSGRMRWKDDEGETGPAADHAPEGETLTASQALRYMRDDSPTRSMRPVGGQAKRSQAAITSAPKSPQEQAMHDLLKITGGPSYITTYLRQIQGGVRLTDDQKKMIRRAMYQRGMKDKAELFR